MIPTPDVAPHNVLLLPDLMSPKTHPSVSTVTATSVLSITLTMVLVPVKVDSILIVQEPSNALPAVLSIVPLVMPPTLQSASPVSLEPLLTLPAKPVPVEPVSLSTEQLANNALLNVLPALHQLELAPLVLILLTEI